MVVCTGVRPAGGIAAAAGAETGPGGALLVDERMRTSLPDVYAAGDCIAPWHRVLGRPAYVPLGPAANKTGRVAGTVAAGGDATFAGVVGTAVVKVFDLEVARTGLTLAEAREAGLPASATDVVHKSRAKYYPGVAPLHVRLVHELGGRLLGAQLVGREGAAKRVDVVAAALLRGPRRGRPRGVRPLLRPAVLPGLRPAADRRAGRAARAGAGMSTRIAVVTGGGSGIGRATCTRLTADGFTLAVLDVDGEAAEVAAGPDGLGCAADVADRHAVDAAFAQVVEAFGRIDVLVNNAGVSGTRRRHDLPRDHGGGVGPGARRSTPAARSCARGRRCR